MIGIFGCISSSSILLLTFNLDNNNSMSLALISGWVSSFYPGGPDSIPGVGTYTFIPGLWPNE